MSTLVRIGRDMETGVIKKPSAEGPFGTSDLRSVFVERRSLWENPPTVGPFGRRVVAKIGKALGISVDDLLS